MVVLPTNYTLNPPFQKQSSDKYFQSSSISHKNLARPLQKYVCNMDLLGTTFLPAASSLHLHPCYLVSQNCIVPARGICSKFLALVCTVRQHRNPPSPAQPLPVGFRWSDCLTLPKNTQVANVNFI